MSSKMRFHNPKRIAPIIIFSVLSVAVVFLLDILAVNYWLRSLIKIVVFGSCVFACAKPNLKSIFTPKKDKSVLISILIGLGVIGIVWGGYFILSKFFDFGTVAGGAANLGVHTDNYWVVTAYIVCVNSLLEEIFFRGMCCLKLEEHSNKVYAYTFSSVLFALYHITMVSNIMNPALTVIGIFGLLIAGILFANLNKRTNNIYNAWIVHACANIAINTIGWFLLA